MMAFVHFLFLLLLFPSTFQFPLPSFIIHSMINNNDNDNDPMFCTEIFSNATFVDYDPQLIEFPNITINAKLKLFRDPETEDYNIRIYDFYGFDFTDNLTAESICYFDNNQCNNNVTKPYDFDLNEFIPLIQFDANFWKEMEGYGLGFFFGYFANESFFPLNGSLFSPQNPCNTFLRKVENVFEQSMEACCINFIPAPKAPPAPACKRFQSTVTFYNGDNTEFAESTMYYFLDGGKIYTVGNYSNVPKYPYMDYFFNGINNCSSKNEPKLKCIITLPPGDSSVFIAMEYSYYDFYTDSSPLDVPIVGSIIFRNGQTLMYEGVPFTPQNACVTHNGHNYANKPTISQFCCTEFA